MHSNPERRWTLDFLAIIAAGPLSWRDRPASATDATAMLMVTMGLCVVAADGVIGLAAAHASAAVLAIGALATVGALAAILAPGFAFLGLAPYSARPFTSRPLLVVMRLTAIVILVGVWGAHNEGLDIVSLWPIGVAAGSDSFITLRRAGLIPTARELWLNAVTSEFHLGGILGLLVVTMLGIIRPTTALGLAITWHVILTVAVVSIVALRRVQTWEDELTVRMRNDVRKAERRVRAHWLHDDVMSALSVTRLKLMTDAVPTALAVTELNDLDHELRLRQLDDLLEAGDIRLAEIIQPYVRRAQALGLAVEGLPGHEVAGVVLAHDLAVRAKRVIAGATSNAIHAGASRLSIRARRSDLHLTIEIEDDAGGFDTDDLPMGRGLDRLKTDLGDDFMVTRTESGTLVGITLHVGATP